MNAHLFLIVYQNPFSFCHFNRRYSEVSLRQPIDIDDDLLTQAIEVANAAVKIESGNECNENVPNMISTLLYV